MTDEGQQSDQDDRLEELLRINAELAAEIRSLTQGRTGEPRSGAGTSARQVSKLVAERDSLATERATLLSELEATRAELEEARRHRDSVGRQVQDYARHIDELSHEVARLRGGPAGIARRLRARLLRR